MDDDAAGKNKKIKKNTSRKATPHSTHGERQAWKNTDGSWKLLPFLVIVLLLFGTYLIVSSFMSLMMLEPAPSKSFSSDPRVRRHFETMPSVEQEPTIETSSVPTDDVTSEEQVHLAVESSKNAFERLQREQQLVQDLLSPSENNDSAVMSGSRSRPDDDNDDDKSASKPQNTVKDEIFKARRRVAVHRTPVEQVHQLLATEKNEMKRLNDGIALIKANRRHVSKVDSSHPFVDAFGNPALRVLYFNRWWGQQQGTDWWSPSPLPEWEGSDEEQLERRASAATCPVSCVFSPNRTLVSPEEADGIMFFRPSFGAPEPLSADEILKWQKENPEVAAQIKADAAMSASSPKWYAEITQRRTTREGLVGGFPLKVKGQQWVIVSMESENYGPIVTSIHPVYSEMMDIIMSTKLSIDGPLHWPNADGPAKVVGQDRDVPTMLEKNVRVVPSPYFSNAEYGDFKAIRPEMRDKKGGLALWLHNNCVAVSHRHDLVQALMSAGLDIHSGGRCLKNKEWPGDLNTKSPTELVASYKFYLSFENVFGDADWVSSTLFRVLDAGTVPVYAGATNIDKFMPSDHAIIKVSDFESAEALVEYLNYLDRNDTAYREYLKWKDEGASAAFRRLMSISDTHSFCRLCLDLASSRKDEYDTVAQLEIEKYQLQMATFRELNQMLDRAWVSSEDEIPFHLRQEDEVHWYEFYENGLQLRYDYDI